MESLSGLSALFRNGGFVIEKPKVDKLRCFAKVDSVSLIISSRFGEPIVRVFMDKASKRETHSFPSGIIRKSSILQAGKWFCINPTGICYDKINYVNK